MGTRDVVKLYMKVQCITWEEQRPITTLEEPNIAMYVILEGCVEKTGEDGIAHMLSPGDSFGEEVLLGVKNKYEYKTSALTTVSMCMIAKREFEECFDSMPDVRDTMRKNVLQMIDRR